MKRPRVSGLLIGGFLFGIIIGGVSVIASLREEIRVDPQLTQEVKRRRQELMDQLGSEALLILFSAEPKTFERDIDYEYRQDSNLYYLTGIDQPGTILVLMPGNRTQKEMLFLRRRDPTRELWAGRMLRQDEARSISGIETIYDADLFDTFIESVLNGRNFGPRTYGPTVEYAGFFDALGRGRAAVYLDLENRPGLRRPPNRVWRFAEKIRRRFLGIDVRDVTPYLHRMRLVKSPYELAQIRRAIEITCRAHREAMKALRPGMYEYEIEAVVEYTFKRLGAAWPAFPSIIASGPNATTLHYDRSTRRTHSGELLLVDIGAEYHYYAADVTRTYPVNGRFTPEQAALYNLVLEAQKEALKLVRPGSTIPQVHQRAVAVLKRGLRRLGLITSEEASQYRFWFPHGTSHWLGMNVHDVGDRNAPFEPGMVLTVEPGLYIRQDTFQRIGQRDPQLAAAIAPAFQKYQGLGVRIEDDVLVTESGYVVLSQSAPKTTTEIETIMTQR
ncbi:MAG: M24 family metallopeptidase [Acidobacteria bacterium]|nr:MAG: M24 family metallopeptidase [Acidobacteriota bacterium]